MDGGVKLLSKKIITTNFRDDSISIISEVYPFKTYTLYINKILNNDYETLDQKGPIDLFMDKKEKLLLVNALNDSLIKIDIKSEKLISFIKLGRYPSNIRIFSDKIYVINSDSNSLSILDEKTMESIETISLGNNPSSIEIDEIYKRIYISNFESYSISVLDFNGGLQEIKIPDKPLKIKISDENIYILSIINNSVYNKSRLMAIDRRSMKNTWSIELDGLFFDLVKVAKYDIFYLINPEDRFLYSFNERGRRLEKSIFLGGLPKKILYDGEENIYINDISNNEVLVVDINKCLVVHRLKVGKEPHGLLLL